MRKHTHTHTHHLLFLWAPLQEHFLKTLLPFLKFHLYSLNVSPKSTFLLIVQNSPGLIYYHDYNVHLFSNSSKIYIFIPASPRLWNGLLKIYYTQLLGNKAGTSNSTCSQLKSAASLPLVILFCFLLHCRLSVKPEVLKTETWTSGRILQKSPLILSLIGYFTII